MAKTPHQPRRIIEAAFFDGAIGPVSARELLAMGEDDWGVLRDRLTDGAHGKANGLTAKCMYCGSRVYISTRRIADVPRPFFAHFQGGDLCCPWHHGRNLTPDQARAAQYQGNQVSLAHQLLCEQVDCLVRMDTRYQRSVIERYLPPTASSFGRYPDVYVEWKDFRPFAIEIQLSRPFQTEISERCIHYEREGVSLLWLFYGVDPRTDDLPQGFRDVIRRHRGNVFVLDTDAVGASCRERTLVLKCYLKADCQEYEPPILVPVDQLTFPMEGLPYLEDRIIGPLCNSIKDRRKIWFEALEPFPNAWHRMQLQSPALDRAFLELAAKFPDLKSDGYSERYEILRLVAVVFSVLCAANDRERNYATAHPNIRAMLNTLLNASSGIGRYVSLIETLIRASKLHRVDQGTVRDHISRAKRRWADNLCGENDPEWKLMVYLVPEIFDRFVREELQYFNALPQWAMASP